MKTALNANLFRPHQTILTGNLSQWTAHGYPYRFGCKKNGAAKKGPQPQG
jgi:hypothetical protein